VVIEQCTRDHLTYKSGNCRDSQGKNISVRMIQMKAEIWTQFFSNKKRIIYWQPDSYFLFFCFHAQSNSSCFQSAGTPPCPTVHCKLQHTHLITASIYKEVYVKLGYITAIQMTIATLRPENKSHKWKYVIKLNILFHRALLFNKDSQVAFHVMTLDIFNVHGSVHRINILVYNCN